MVVNTFKFASNYKNYKGATMTEQIIIDGVDVSGCKYFTTEQPHLGVTCLDTLSSKLVCSDISNCYYKRLKRLEKENCKLRNEIEKLKQGC